jgi:hypothetical protein
LAQANAGAGEQLAIMDTASCRDVGANNLGGSFVNHNLRFYRMALFLAGVAASLLFLGRSTGVSVASTKTTSKIVSAASSAFFPGKRNRPLCISVFSTSE